ncbi:glucosamine-6-phosphate deaminase [Sporothrix brasiliensis 5110]|uniref:Glucosamine-6-phosphate isomerase n=1 Tax=Sporothrix brasiliensis 5110 TaxID=1398154 RepID=A0A0C2FIW6_9PEZI|nr:glucosamine-6-phosphate deaminase [Sporothrix brasiliensis 5110]KIH91083.1 glucosamine-6-phosphate deaminase [Sporothrix brasiliensis 5110]
MRLLVRPDPEAASRYVADYIVDRINAFAPSAERPFVLGLPTGSSPLLIYRFLVAAYAAGRVSFRHVVTFNMDEYVALPRDHPQSYHSFMFAHLFRHIDIPADHVRILDGNPPGGDYAGECARYEAAIRAVGGIELFLGGVGSDGHLAFNEPGSSLASRTRIKSLAPETRRANARFFGADAAAVPQMALTVGVATVLDAREVVVIATGARKALAVQQAVEGGVSHMCTLSSLQLHPRSLVVVDDEATVECKVKTINYFRGVEQTVQLASQPGLPRAAQTPPRLDTAVAAMAAENGELTPDSMSSRIGSPKMLAVRSATIPFALMRQ